MMMACHEMEAYIFAVMKLNTVIFDMDGLLIDSEPLWNEAASEIFNGYGVRLTEQQYASTTGLRTREFLVFWFTHFKIPVEHINEAEIKIINKVIELVKQKGRPLPGISHIFNFFTERNFKIGLATSSPPDLINEVIDLLGIRDLLQAISSANDLPHGKPHPEVYLNCARQLSVLPGQCICFEDSYNGMIAAKAARMKCVIVPSLKERNKPSWEAADLRISTLQNFNELLLSSL
jgi:mannitol-1-/sugar-/sorbitol-6-/2-deoxyglucose-6-phosphatase